jgi:hypothetical protein
VVVIVVRRVYIIFVVPCAAVSEVHRSRDVSRLEFVGIRNDGVTSVCCYVGWRRGIFFCTYLFLTVVFCCNSYFR